MMKKILLGGAILIAFVTMIHIVFLASESGGIYIVTLVRDEQNDHYQQMQKNVLDLTHVHKKMESSVDLITTRRLTVDEKDQIREDLRYIEEIGLNMSRESLFYSEDTTVHLFFTPEAPIVKYFDQTRNTPLYIERFVRAMDHGLFVSYLTREQKDMIIQNYMLLTEELARIK